mmetsp:Transcript_1661/g.5146  ORF Transcript_1661/g.5146 Transcript_1661/m.5146 type:complete len:532 (-) Transcript_1661:788-2383(-)
MASTSASAVERTESQDAEPRPESDSEQGSGEGKTPAEQLEAAADDVTKGCGSWLLGVAGVFLALSGTVLDLATQGLVSRQGGAVMLTALTAVRASLSWAASLFSFIFLGGMSLIGAAVGEGNDLKAGRYARLCVVIALAVGSIGTLVLVLCRDLVLDLFSQEAVAAEGRDLFTLKAPFLWLMVLTVALNGIMLGFMYIHAVVAFVILGTALSLGLVYPLFLLTDLGLRAFAVASITGSLTSVVLSLTYLLQRSRRQKFGLGLGLQGISLADVRELGRSFGCLAFRSFVVETPYMLSITLAIRLSPVHGAVFQLLMAQSNMVDRIVAGFAWGINFMGSRLWGGRYFGAFWCLVFGFLLYLATPVAVVFTIIELVRGPDSLAETFAKTAERAYFDAVMTNRVFVFYILIVLARAYYSIIDQALIAMQEFQALALIQGLSFVAYLSVALSGYFMQDFSILLLGSAVFLLCRIVGGLFVMGRKLRVHPRQPYRKRSITDPEHALKLTIDDPTVAKVFGGRTPKSTEHSEAEFEAV